MGEKKKCKYCQSEIDKKAKICPNCRKNQDDVSKKIVLGIISFILFWAFILTITDTSPVSTNNNISSNDNQNIIQEKFTLSKETSGYNEYNTFCVVGSIKNNVDKQYSYVQVTFNLYNKAGAQIGTAIDNINNLEPNGIWKFKAVGFVDETVDTYKLTGITGW